MIKIILATLLISVSLSASAFQEADVNVSTGVGLFGSRGVLGVSVDKFLAPNHAVAVGFGFDFIGATSFLGYKYFSDGIHSSNNFWDKCFFVFECTNYYYAGGGIQYASGTHSKVTEDDVIREYDTQSKWLGLAVVGARSVFKNNLTLDAEISYRSIMTGGRSTQTAGPVGDDTKWLESGYRSLGFGIALGYAF